MQVSGKSARESSNAPSSAAAALRPPPAVRLNDPEKLEISIERFGNEKNPILVVDNALANPDEVRECALGLQFDRSVAERAYYPGYVASCALRGVEAIGRWAGRHVWSQAFGLDADAPTALLDQLAVNAFFAVFAPEKDHKYGIVHSDAHSWLAMLIYLTPGEENASATGFWRHIPTGLESGCTGTSDPFSLMLKLDAIFKTRLIESARTALRYAPKFSYGHFLRDAFSKGAPPFPSGDHGAWEMIGSVAAKYNRLVVYPTYQFHSVVTNRPELATTLDAARLTLNVFIKHPLFEDTGAAPIGPLTGVS
jgi:hypothetical protein